MLSATAVVVTAALADPGQTPLSSGKQPHGLRAYLLRCHLLPRLREMGFAEILVVGEFEPGDGYTWLNVPSVERSSIHDSIRKRHAGCLRASAPFMLVMNDDHLLERDLLRRAEKYVTDQGADVVSPSRWTRLRGPRERLNAGDGAYVCGHAALYRREVLERCPWDAVPKIFSFDVAHSQQMRDAGFCLCYPDDVQIEDIEMGATPWS